jgi:heme oxygenase
VIENQRREEMENVTLNETKPAKRFGTKQFLEAWKKHGETARNWDVFVKQMRLAARDASYPEHRIAERIEQFSKDLKEAGIKPPKYPKKRLPAAVSAARALGWR